MWLVLLLMPLANAEHQRSFDISGQTHFTETSFRRYQEKMAKLNELQQKILGVRVTQNSPSNFEPTLYESEQRNPERNPLLFEGDIVLTDAQLDKIIRNTEDQLYINNPSKYRDRRSMISDLNSRWTFPIPYFINTATGVDEQAVLAGINEWQTRTCVQFRRQYYQPTHYGLEFIHGTSCSSYIGRAPLGSQTVSIGPGCEALGIVCHEIGHALGFYHEQSRYDRDQYVIVNQKNIQPYYLNQFTKFLKSDMVDYGVEYDYGSIMHYNPTAFTSRGGVTIIPRDNNYENTIGYRGPPSFSDVKKVNFAYCNGTCPNKLNCQNSGYTDPKDCRKCRCPDGFGGTLCDRAAENPSKCGTGDLTTKDTYQSISLYGSGKCSYVIKAPPGHRIEYQITESQFQNNSPCEDYIELKYKEDVVTTGPRFCGTKRPSILKSESNQLVVIYNGIHTSRAYLIYKHDAPPVITTSTPRPTFTRYTTQRPYWTTRRTSSTTTSLPRWVTFFPSKICTDWSFCSAPCGGCGQHLRTCHSGVETQNCNFEPCGFNFCCFPYTYDSLQKQCISR